MEVPVPGAGLLVEELCRSEGFCQIAPPADRLTAGNQGGKGKMSPNQASRSRPSVSFRFMTFSPLFA
jgi:hypothetical protein